MSMTKKQQAVLVGVNGYEDAPLLARCLQAEAPACEFVFLSDPPLSSNELIARARNAVVLFSQYQEMSDAVYAALPNLKAYCALGVGYNAANVEAASRHGVLVTNVPDYCTEEVAEHTAALILHCHRKLYAIAPLVAGGAWGYRNIRPIRRFSDCTVGFFGFGRIAQETARLLNPFGAKLLAYGPGLPETQFTALGVKAVSFDEMIRRADFVSLHAPLTETNQGCIDEAVLEKMRPNAYLINTARGGLVDADALLRVMQRGHLAGAALDVFAEEPTGSAAERALLALPNVLATGHTAFYSEEALRQLAISAAKEAGRILRGEPSLYCVNRHGS